MIDQIDKTQSHAIMYDNEEQMDKYCVEVTLTCLKGPTLKVEMLANHIE